MAFTVGPSLIWQLATAFSALQQYMNSSAVRHGTTCGDDDRAFYDFDRDGIDDLEGLVHRRQEVNMDIEMEDRRSCLLPDKTLMDVDIDLKGEN